MRSAREVAHERLKRLVRDCRAIRYGHSEDCERETAAILADREEVREACALVAFGEKLNDATGHDEDLAYDLAVSDCCKAIRAIDLRRGDTPGGG